MQHKTFNIDFDLIATNKSGHIVLFVKVYDNQFNINIDSFFNNLNTYLTYVNNPLLYSIIFTNNEIKIFKYYSNLNKMIEILLLNSINILKYYEPNYGEKRIYHHYLVGLIQAWLDDLCYNWKSEIPPGYKDINSIGLLQHIHQGFTFTNDIF